MGCLKLSYFHSAELKLISLKKVVTSKKSENNVRSGYMFGFNGMLKDNELKGVGNSLDFGARMHDSRIARLNQSTDPLMGQFPWLSPYLFSGNNPILFIDKEGEKREIYTTIIDERNGNAVIVKQTTNQLYKNRTSFNETVFGLKTSTWVYNYNWHDYQTFNEIRIDKDGNRHEVGSVDRVGVFRTNTYYDWGEGYANTKLNFSNKFKPVREDDHDGYMFTTKNALVGGNEGSKYNARGNGPSVNIDDILAAFSMASASGSINKDASLAEGLSFLNNVAQSFSGSVDKPIEVCVSCHEVKQNGKPISKDSAEKVSTPSNSDTVPTSSFHK